jgi:hypothetical protein
MGERRYSSHSYLTLALDGGEWSASCPSRALPPGKGPLVPIGLEAGWAPEPVWTQGLEEKSSAPAGDRTPIVQPIVRHHTVWATAAPNVMGIMYYFLIQVQYSYVQVKTYVNCENNDIFSCMEDAVEEAINENKNQCDITRFWWFLANRGHMSKWSCHKH